MHHSKIRNFLKSLFFNSSDLGFKSKILFFCSFCLIFCPLDPDPWIRIFLQIWIQIKEAKILRIQRIRIWILSTGKNHWKNKPRKENLDSAWNFFFIFFELEDFQGNLIKVPLVKKEKHTTAYVVKSKFIPTISLILIKTIIYCDLLSTGTAVLKLH